MKKVTVLWSLMLLGLAVSSGLRAEVVLDDAQDELIVDVDDNGEQPSDHKDHLPISSLKPRFTDRVYNQSHVVIRVWDPSSVSTFGEGFSDKTGDNHFPNDLN